jgi:6-phosphofructokinase 1
MHCGAVSPGMNASVRVVVRMATNKGYNVLGILDGFKGLIEDKIRKLDWSSVNGWAIKGGAELGTRRVEEDQIDLKCVVESLKRNNIQG